MLIFGAIGALLSTTVLFNIGRIEVETASDQYSASKIIEASEVREGSNLFTLNAKKIEQNIATRLPYVESVTLKRVLPDKLVIVTEDAKAQYQYAFKKGYLLVSQNGKVLEKVKKKKPDMMVIKAELADKPKAGYSLEFLDPGDADAFAGLMDKLREYDLLEETSYIDFSDPLNISLLYQGRLKIVLGSILNLDLKLGSAVDMCTQRLEPDEMGILDVSIINEATFQPRDELF